MKMIHHKIAMFLLVVCWIAVGIKADDCPENCPRGLISPVCDSEGNLFYDQCNLEKENCNNGLKAVPWSECQPKCPRACTLEYLPRCGSDGEIYGNKCSLLSESCGKSEPITEQPMDNCLNAKCPDNCVDDDEECKNLVARCKLLYQG